MQREQPSRHFSQYKTGTFSSRQWQQECLRFVALLIFGKIETDFFFCVLWVEEEVTRNSFATTLYTACVTSRSFAGWSRGVIVLTDNTRECSRRGLVWVAEIVSYSRPRWALSTWSTCQFSWLAYVVLKCQALCGIFSSLADINSVNAVVWVWKCCCDSEIQA